MAGPGTPPYIISQQRRAGRRRYGPPLLLQGSSVPLDSRVPGPRTPTFQSASPAWAAAHDIGVQSDGPIPTGTVNTQVVPSKVVVFPAMTRDATMRKTALPPAAQAIGHSTYCRGCSGKTLLALPLPVAWEVWHRKREALPTAESGSKSEESCPRALGQGRTGRPPGGHSCHWQLKAAPPQSRDVSDTQSLSGFQGQRHPPCDRFNCSLMTLELTLAPSHGSMTWTPPRTYSQHHDPQVGPS